MLRIRLARTGKKKKASYRVVVADQRRAVQSKFVEILGWYNPHTKELEVNKEKLEGWLSKGANPSNSMAVLLKRQGINLPDWVKIVQKNKPKKGEEKEEKKAEAPVVEETVKETKEEGADETTPEETKEEVEKEETEIAQEAPEEAVVEDEVKEGEEFKEEAENA